MDPDKSVTEKVSDGNANLMGSAMPLNGPFGIRNTYRSARGAAESAESKVVEGGDA